jgi:serine/threonine-protein phosphatase PGAM5
MERTDPGEVQACNEQLERAFAMFFTPSPSGDVHEILVCHGNVIRYFVTRVLEVDPEAWLGMSIGNCSLTVVRVNPDRTMKLFVFGDVGHIPPNLQTGWDRNERPLVVPDEGR